MTGGNNRHTIGMGNKRKKIRFDWKNFICGSINYTVSVAPLLCAALCSQGANGELNPVYAFIAPTVAWLGENVKSVTLSDVEYNPDLKECFDEESKRALYRAWDKVFEKWVTELSDISDSDIDDLKKDSYEKIFHFEEDSGTAYIDKSLLTANEIKNLISTILQNRLNAEGTWEDEELNKIAEAVMMNFFVELELGIRKEPTLYNQLDIGEIKKSLGVIESKLKNMCSGAKGAYHGPAPIPEEGKWIQAKEIKDISGYTHGIGWCAPQQGACKLSLNVKDGVIQEALVETIGCTGMTHSAAMASEILPGKTILEALNTDLVCDAINTAMRELFLQIVYGRTQSAFSEGGLVIGAGLEDLGKGLRSQTGTLYGTVAKGTRYLELTEGYITKQFLDKDNQVCGYEYVHLGKMMEAIKDGMDANEAVKKFTGSYGRTTAEQGIVKVIDPRKE